MPPRHRRRLNEQEFKEDRAAVDRDDYVDKRRAQDARVEVVCARERAADAAVPRDRAVLAGGRGSCSGQGALGDPERRASVDAQNDRDMRAAI